jgi:hypothetical protein
MAKFAIAVDGFGTSPSSTWLPGRIRPSMQNALDEIVHFLPVHVRTLPLRPRSSQWHDACSKGAADFQATESELREGRGAVVVVVAVQVDVDTWRQIASAEKRVA